MVAGISGATPGSGGALGPDDDSDGRLMLLHAPRNIVSAEAIARLATTRALPDPIIAFPPSIFGRTRPAANRKTPAGAMTSIQLRRRPDLVSQEASYIGLTKALTPLLDRIGAKPYSPATISTQIRRLLRQGSAVPARDGVEYPGIISHFDGNQTRNQASKRKPHGQIQIPPAA
jgi:hypothetical protein